MYGRCGACFPEKHAIDKSNLIAAAYGANLANLSDYVKFGMPIRKIKYTEVC